MNLWVIGAIVGGIVALHLLLSFLESKGLIYYRKGGGGAATSNALGAVQEVFEPKARHVREARQEVKKEAEDGDDDPRV